MFIALLIVPPFQFIVPPGATASVPAPWMVPAVTNSVPVASVSVTPAPIVAVTLLVNECVPAPVSVAVLLNVCVPVLKSMVVPAAASKLPVCVPPVVWRNLSVPAPDSTCTAPVLLKFAGSSDVMALPALFLNRPALLNVPFGDTDQSSMKCPTALSCRSNTPPTLLLTVAPLANVSIPLAAPLSVTVPVLVQVPVS